MTPKQFMSRLKEVSKTRKFSIVCGTSQLRYKNRCPIEVVAGTRAGTIAKAIFKLGLYKPTATTIAWAADADIPLTHRYRKALLKATGLA